MDKLYWQEYYKKHEAPIEPSHFARFVLERYVSTGDRLVEFGCGNGRDARFFGEHGVSVVAYDQASSEIDELSSRNKLENIKYEPGDFTSLADTDDGVDVVYSRFTLHSVDRQGQSRALAWAARNLVDGGRLCIEVRGKKNDLYGKGIPVDSEPDAFIYNDHYRRFLDKHKLDEEVASNGLTIVSSREETGYAPFDGEDNFFIRQISRK
ncbi:methyltransferase domain-containing protein [Candidatus Saccharibacteria bacterium]|nr:methyltransferase domain-containing protein [Candidatus Saccharibacteria bacterium]